MERNERETVDFMNVESFSQLPFTRPAAREKGIAIRLFGKEFGGGNKDDGDGEVEGRKELVSSENYSMSRSSSNSSTETSSRKFVCHYCCRNFPTSQALGGHQNAHKRERQDAKRAHLRNYGHGHGHGHDHNYHLMSYSRFGSAPAAAVALPPPYHSWNGGGGSSTASYAAPVPQPINGSPLGLWRIPAAAQTPPFPHIHRQMPLLNEQLKPLISTPQSPFAFESKPAVMQDHVSLDLRL